MLFRQNTLQGRDSYVAPYDCCCFAVRRNPANGVNRHSRARRWRAGAFAEALILAEPGDEIVLEAGRYTLTDRLSLDADGVTVRSAGIGDPGGNADRIGKLA